MNELMRGSLEMEATVERKAVVIGRLGDLGLGSPDGIPSYLADATAEELQEVAERDNERLVDPNDLQATACIDGRHCSCNADGSEAKIRLRRVGGSASNTGAAFNAEASIVSTIDRNSPLADIISTIDQRVGYRSAHLGGCGGANGEVSDNVAISEKPEVINAAKALLSIPEVANYLQLDVVKEEIGDAAYEDLFMRVKQNAVKTAALLETKGWDGQAYVDGVKKACPENVEDLEVDHEEETFHGHKEPKLTIIIGNKTMPLDDDGFTWNLKATKQFAEAISGQRGREGYLQAIIADVAKHMAVASRLPSDKTPVILQAA